MEEKRGGSSIVSGIVIIAAVFAVAYLFYNISMIGKGSDAPQSLDTPTMGAQMTATMAPSEPEPTATPFYTPTPNIEATAQYNAVLAAEINLQAAETQAAGVIIAANIAATTEANKAISAERVAQIEADAQRERDEAANQGAAIANERIRLETEAERVKQDERRAIPNIILAVAALIFSVFLFVWLVLSWRAREVVTDSEEVTENELAPLSWPVVQVNQSDGMGAMQHEPITLEQARRMSAAGIDAPLSFRNVSEFIKRAEWDEIRRALVPVFADYNRDGSLVLNSTGQELIRKMTGETK